MKLRCALFAVCICCAFASGENLLPATGDFDTILSEIGVGKWNLLHYFVIASWRTVLPYHAIAGAFFSPPVNHTCRLEGQSQQQTNAPSNNVTIDALNDAWNSSVYIQDSCTYFKKDTTTGRLEEMPCTEWDFDNSTFSSTVTSEFNLVCDKQYLRVTYQSIYMGGFLVGSLFNGHLAYRYGRLTMIIISSISYSIMALVSAWIPYLELLLIFRFLLGTMHPTSLATGHILLMEITEVNWRATVAVSVGTMWGVGTALWGMFAYLERDWRWLQTYVSLTGPLIIPFLWFLDESPRWLVVTGRHKKALSILQRAARLNKTSLPPTNKLVAIMKKVRNQAESNNSNQGSMFRQLALIFSTRKLITVTVATCIGFCAVAMIFFGLTLSGSALGIENPFTYVVISGLIELPAVFGIIFISKLGRRLYGMVIFGIGAMCLLLQPVISDNLQWLSVTLIMIGKLSSTSAFMVMFLYSSELYPTEVRTQGFSFGMVLSRVGAFIAPYIIGALENSHPWAIFVVFGLMAALASVSFLPLWETQNTSLPDTIAEMRGRSKIPKSNDHSLIVCDKANREETSPLQHSL